MIRYDILVVGAGIAGASLAAELAAHASVLMIEAEDAPGRHATGRSVAFWSETYGGPGIQPLSVASRPFLARPDPAFSEQSFLLPRGELHIGRAEDEPLRAAMMAAFADAGTGFSLPDAAALRARIPGLRDAWVVGLEEPSTMDIDVAALHAACLRRFARAGGTLRTRAGLRAARRVAGGWIADIDGQEIGCDLIVNAAGAWADPVAMACGIAPIGIAPLRRSVVQLRVDPPATDSLPLVMDLRGAFYFKPVGGGRLWLTPHDEVPSAPCDAAPEEMDIAVAIDRFQNVVDWPILAVERRWAGLRSFAPDRLPVYGRDVADPAFFWFAGQGGFGIQTAPAAALVGCALMTGEALDPAVAGIDPARFSPARFASGACKSVLAIGTGAE
ncbi:FAD-dependent oxidoreductase [Sphingobium aquiterrae]|uniref:NAD(P)/FAD-dependent oxidoreductase n=1 Tax=Sphingobium aquiterrae TaxID=2038656 RepID=UPI003017B4F1